MNNRTLSILSTYVILDDALRAAHDFNPSEASAYSKSAHGEINLGQFSDTDAAGDRAGQRAEFVPDDTEPGLGTLGVFGWKADLRRRFLAHIANELEPDTALILAGSDTDEYDDTGQYLLSHFTLRDLIASACADVGFEAPETIGTDRTYVEQLAVFTRLLKRYPVVICDLPDRELASAPMSGQAFLQALMTASQAAGRVLLFTSDAPKGSALGDVLWDSCGAAVELRDGSEDSHLVRFDDDDPLPFEARIWL